MEEREQLMKKNVGLLDRFFRIGIGILSLSIVFVGGDFALILIFGIVALFAIVTSVIGYCPVNAKFGLDTRKKQGNK